MAKINIKLDKQFLSELTGSLNKSSLEGNKKLLNIFDLINNHKKDATIDIKEITDFANSIFAADTNNDGEVNQTELETYVNENKKRFEQLKIEACDILDFLNIFKTKADKTDKKNQRITNSDGSYSIIYEEKIIDLPTYIGNNTSLFDTKEHIVTKKINYTKNNEINTIETTENNKTTVTDKDGTYIGEKNPKKALNKIQDNSTENLAEESRIKNNYYTSTYTYTKIKMDNKIVIKDSENSQTIIDKEQLLGIYSAHDKDIIWNVIKDLPAEALLDLVTEVTFSDEALGKGVGGEFSHIFDKIVIGEIVSPDVVLHEMGHAIDCLGVGEDNYQTMHNEKFKQAFIDDMKRFQNDGHKRATSYYSKDGEYKIMNKTYLNATTNKNSNYATVSEQEMFAECYALLMGGTCQSEAVINEYFRNTLACVQEIVENTRKLPKSQRHIA